MIHNINEIESGMILTVSAENNGQFGDGSDDDAREMATRMVAWLQSNISDPPGLTFIVTACDDGTCPTTWCNDAWDAVC